MWQLSVNIFISVGCLTAITGGQSHSYPNFHAQRDGTKFAEELRRIVTRPFGFDAVLRVRCSTGLSVIEHYGNFFMRNSTDLEFGVIDSEKAFGVQFKNDGKIPDNTEVFFQIALVYTNAVGKRRIRVLNLSLTSTSQVANMFKFADMDATLNFLSKAGNF